MFFRRLARPTDFTARVGGIGETKKTESFQNSYIDVGYFNNVTNITVALQKVFPIIGFKTSGKRSS